MSDRRLTPANRRVAAMHLRGQVEAEMFVEGVERSVAVPVADLLDAPNGRRERQVLAGQVVRVFEQCEGWAFVQAVADGFVGYLKDSDLQAPLAASHRVIARSTHVYPEADFKAQEVESLSFGSLLDVTAEAGRFFETSRGFVPRAHLQPNEARADDPVEVAERFLGTPYLWGGNSGFGIDCSGLVQAACHACGIACPGDSDLQEAELGEDLGNRPPKRGDLYFWKGHVGWVVDKHTLLHANVHHMAVAYEGLDAAVERIEAQGDGPVTARKRLGEWT